MKKAIKKDVLLGDEAVALAAFQAGLTAAFSYPGTPASEIMEYLIRLARQQGGVKATWCVNEKVAYEEALGVSFAGKRALVSMKHVGLNVAADPFMNSALTKILGGLVVVVADDPSMHSSQNEQDSRYYAHFARIFCLEPSNHQEAYEMTRVAFDLSEKYHIPILLRLVTRFSHSRSEVVYGDKRDPNPLRRGDWQDWTLLPANARRRFAALLDIQQDLVREANSSPFNSLTLSPTSSLGIITSGIGYNYVQENINDLDQPPSILKISTYPLPLELIQQLMSAAQEILIVEEGYPFIEERLRGLLGVQDKIIRGKLSGDLPLTGELTPDTVRAALGLAPLPRLEIEEKLLASRPPQLCPGCPHYDTFVALKEALKGYSQATVFSDIGCYTLGALPPLSAIDTCVCMGASVSMAKGGAEAGLFPSVAVIGDSTFTHSGMTPLLDAAAANVNMTVVIVDNAVVAMTGGQPTYATGERLAQICAGLGVAPEHIRQIIPLPKNKEVNSRVIKEEIEYPGTSVVISTRECIQEVKKRAKRR
ncbi:MAG: indolepyruvate ferredoxin oxidoreductase [Candidatus Aminicenantes bacterium]|nr:indolepyruvate ferredoxin oxidoreductase [Candidatus Aminicenantes bacterium]